MQDEAIYRCINPACARAMPRRVNFCPYCGTVQMAGTPAPASAPVAGDVHADRAPAPSAATPGTADGPTAAAPTAATGVSAAAASAASGPAGRASGTPPRSDAATPSSPSAHAFGHSGRPVDAGAASAASPERGRGIPWTRHPAAPATPQGRRPIRLRWWIIALVVLWGVWLWAKPSTKKIDRRIDAAIALAQACQGKQAQDELIALRATRATPRQLERLQRALNEASSACTRKRQRARAWDDARGPIESALAARNPERARTRLAAFTKRWGEDDDTRAVEARIEALKREHPLAVPQAGDDADAPPVR